MIRSAYELNGPAAVECGPASDTAGDTRADPGEPAERSFCSVSGQSVIIESVKAPEAAADPVFGGDGKRLILRLYESLGGRVRTTLSFSRNINTVYATDMLEENGRQIPIAGNKLDLEFRAFEIKTLLVSL